MNTHTERSRCPARGQVTGTGLYRLHHQLTVAAQAHGVLDVAYRVIDTPVGPLLLAATELGLVRVAYAAEDHNAVLQTLSDRLSPRVLHAPARLDRAAREIEEYFAGRRTVFDLALDWQLLSGFRATVLRHLVSDVPYGQTTSYSELAALAGGPAAFRAVGTACSTNPLPVVVPCHRVVRADGSRGGYLGGAAARRTLLAVEAAA
jgi:methylated-DNA-[protein]-cysteine S-methyltransferase